MMTHGDPYRKKVIACEEVSFTIVLLNLFLRGREKRPPKIEYLGGRLAKCGKTARLVGTRNNLNEAQSVKLVKLGAPESRLYREKLTPATRIKS